MTPGFTYNIIGRFVNLRTNDDMTPFVEELNSDYANIKGQHPNISQDNLLVMLALRYALKKRKVEVRGNEMIPANVDVLGLSLQMSVAKESESAVRNAAEEVNCRYKVYCAKSLGTSRASLMRLLLLNLLMERHIDKEENEVRRCIEQLYDILLDKVRSFAKKYKDGHHDYMYKQAVSDVIDITLKLRNGGDGAVNKELVQIIVAENIKDSVIGMQSSKMLPYEDARSIMLTILYDDFTASEEIWDAPGINYDLRNGIGQIKKSLNEAAILIPAAEEYKAYLQLRKTYHEKYLISELKVSTLCNEDDVEELDEMTRTIRQAISEGTRPTF